MPIRTLQGFDLKYYLTCLNDAGADRLDDPDGINGQMVPRLAEELARNLYTDVFLISHGWLGDIPAAARQYDRWIAAMAASKEDVVFANKIRPGFRPLLIGIHWPSLPYGDEELTERSGTPFSNIGPFNSVPIGIPGLIEAYAKRIADSPTARNALETIFAAAATDPAPPKLPRDVASAYRTLNNEAKLGDGGPADAPGSDREPFDPDVAYNIALEQSELSFGAFGISPLLDILRNLSFFKMKDRARTIGETSVHRLLTTLQGVAKTLDGDVRLHLMGHSFGCIVISSTLAGSPGKSTIDPVHSAFLAQGALSLWSYCTDIPHAKGQPGYFRSVIDTKRVTGALLTTQSSHDTAVCKMYPLAAGARGDVDFDQIGFPKYGALGEFGARGLGVNAIDLEMLDTNQAYHFDRGNIYNIDGSKYIAAMESLGSGAHNDIAHPQIAHAMWSAVLL